MKQVIFTLTVFLVLCSSVQGQQAPPLYDWNTAKLSWTWNQAKGGPAEAFNMVCWNPADPPNTTIVHNFPGTTMQSILVKDFLALGTWECSLDAMGPGGQSVQSPSIVFQVASPLPPNAPGQPQIQ